MLDTLSSCSLHYIRNHTSCHNMLLKVALPAVRPSHVRAISSIKSMLKLDWERPSSGDRKSKIVCTVGPATDNPEMLSSLLTAGMNCMRLNFSHGSHEHKARLIEELRGEVGKFRALGPRAIDWTDGSNEQVCCTVRLRAVVEAGCTMVVETN